MKGDILKKLLPNMGQLTWDRMAELGIKNAQNNLKYFGEGFSLSKLRETPLISGNTAIVIAAGPSLYKRDPVQVLKKNGYEGVIIATESALRYCLSNDLVPDLVVTIDPRPRIRRWFGIPGLTESEVVSERYNSRQNLDSGFEDEFRANNELIELNNKYGAGVAIALSTTSSTELVERALEIGMIPYWYNPMLDDPDLPGSQTRKMQLDNGMPSVNGGGNVGAACWMMATAVLEKQSVALTGMDYSYYPGTPLELTQYYQSIVEAVGSENIDSLFMSVDNPYDGNTYFTDPAYAWYKEIILEMVNDSDSRTYNCTEGGILFGPGIEYMPLKQFVIDQI